GLTVPQIARQVAAEGARRVVVVTDEPWKYAKNEEWPRGLTIHHRDELIPIQQELAAIPGVTVLIYDQTCAAEKRRRRTRGRSPRCPTPSCRRSPRPTTSSSPGLAAPGSSPSAAFSAWRPISRARASASSIWPVSPRRAGRSTATSALPSVRRTSTPSASRRVAP